MTGKQRLLFLASSIVGGLILGGSAVAIMRGIQDHRELGECQAVCDEMSPWWPVSTVDEGRTDWVFYHPEPSINADACFCSNPWGVAVRAKPFTR